MKWSDDCFVRETQVTVLQFLSWISISLCMYLHRALLRLCEALCILVCNLRNKYVQGWARRIKASKLERLVASTGTTLREYHCKLFLTDHLLREWWYKKSSLQVIQSRSNLFVKCLKSLQTLFFLAGWNCQRWFMGCV